MLHSNCKLPFIFTYIRIQENTHGLLQKIQGTYFKISALYFKIYGLYFSPFQIAEKQCLEKGLKSTASKPLKIKQNHTAIPQKNQPPNQKNTQTTNKQLY